MPKIPIDYKLSVIYKIQHIEKLELLYVGSTTNFIKRKQYHKQNCNDINNKKYNLLVYKIIRDNGGWFQFKMIVIKEFPCNSKIELLIEEDRLMMELKSNMNKLRAFRTQKQYQLDNKESILEQRKQYRLDNKESIKERKSTKFICECGSEICFDHKARHLRTEKHLKSIKI